MHRLHCSDVANTTHGRSEQIASMTRADLNVIMHLVFTGIVADPLQNTTCTEHADNVIHAANCA